MIMGKRVSSASFHYYRTPYSHIEIGNVDQIGYPETIAQYVSIVGFCCFGLFNVHSKNANKK